MVCSFIHPLFSLSLSLSLSLNNRVSKTLAFTLIEVSIVLVIIGLIVGGVLIGQDLIKASELRATVSQIEQYNTAVHTFKLKYNCFPGDCSSAANFGFVSRAGTSRRGDGNELIEGYNYPAAGSGGSLYETGEPILFWRDLSEAGIIPDTLSTATDAAPGATVTLSSSPGIADYMPKAEIGRSQYFYVYSQSGRNYYQLSAIYQMSTQGHTLTYRTLPVSSAYQMDSKVDDGKPTTGSVTATYLSNATGIYQTTAAGSSTSVTCYETTNNNYSTDYDNGQGQNCALAFLFN